MKIELNPGAELCVKAMHLKEINENSIRTCISRYTKPDSFCKSLSWIVFRVVNAFKSIFGQSEWQITNQMLHQHALELAKEKKLFQIIPQEKLNKKINVNIVDTTRLVASKLLSICLLANQLQSEASTELMEKLAPLDLENALSEIEKNVNEIIGRA